MTERLYYADASLGAFDATVQTCDLVDGRLQVTLDRTAFYPTSGGQPHDTGFLGDRAVVDVVDRDDGRIGHIVDGPLTVGARVDGRIDFARRFDHMQQHTGQHILSAAFDALHGARTVGFHLGPVVSSLDLDTPLPPEALAAAEDESNRVVWENRDVLIRNVPSEEAAAFGLRKESARTGMLRVIEVAGFDRSACGGTHVSRTGQVGVIVVRSWERLRGGLRLEFVCGGRAVREFRHLREAVAGSIRFLSVAPSELPEAIERLQSDNKTQQRAMRAFQEQLAAHEAAALVARGERVGATTVVVEFLEGWDQNGLKALAGKAIEVPGVVVVLASATEPRALVVGRARDVIVDAGAVLKTLAAAFGGKGGGRSDLAQGGGLTGSADAIRKAAWAEIERQIGAARRTTG